MKIRTNFTGPGKDQAPLAHISLRIAAHSAPLKTAFTISRGSKMCAETVRVEITAGEHAGRGESVPYARYGESVASVIDQIEAVRGEIELGAGRAELKLLLPAGAARCAVDCALWELEARQAGRSVWQLAGLGEPGPVETAQTVTLAPPAEMARLAAAVPGRLLKLKLGGPGDMERVAAVHGARPEARLILDGNEAISPADLDALARQAAGLGVVLIEQPLPAGKDDTLRRGRFAVPVCADESAHTASDIPALSARYDGVNVKLDKAGGLTGGLEMLQAARAAGLVTMVGCMVAGSLSLAPAVIAAQGCDFADLDGPAWLAGDVPHALVFEDGNVLPPDPRLWG